LVVRFRTVAIVKMSLEQGRPNAGYLRSEPFISYVWLSPIFGKSRSCPVLGSVK